MTKVHGHITRKGVKGTITQNGAFNWDYYWLSRYVSDLTLSQSDDDVILAWNNNGTVDWDYILIERKLSGGDYAQIAQITKTLETYTDENFTVEGTYYYRIRLIKGTHYSDYCTAVSIAISLAPDGSPINLRVTAITDTTQTFVWDIGSTNHDGHILYISTDKGVTYTEKGSVTGATATYQATGLTAGTLYYFYVVAYKGSTESTATNIYDTYFKITIDTTKAGSANDTFVLPTTGGGFNAYVDWGEGGAEQNIVGTPGNVSHTYAAQGTYQIKIRGVMKNIYFHDTGDKLKVMSIDNWGNNNWTYVMQMFFGCQNMVANYIDIPNFSAITSVGNLFRNCYLFNGKVVGIDLANCYDFTAMFLHAHSFNQPVDNLVTSTAWDIHAIFEDAWAFNQPLTGWDTRNATTLNRTFYRASSFNSSVAIDTSKVQDFANCFDGASAFNQPINWDTGAGTTMSYMFNGCTNFNQPVNFNTVNVTNMTMMFMSCGAFNRPLPFNMAKVTNVDFMIYQGAAGIWNQDISAWDVSSLTTASDFIRTGAFSTANYDALLIAWAALTLKPNVTFSVWVTKYSAGAAATARGVLTGAPNNWVITDGGQVA